MDLVYQTCSTLAPYLLLLFLEARLDAFVDSGLSLRYGMVGLSTLANVEGHFQLGTRLAQGKGFMIDNGNKKKCMTYA